MLDTCDTRDPWRFFDSEGSRGSARIFLLCQQDPCDTRDTWRILTPEDLADLRGFLLVIHRFVEDYDLRTLYPLLKSATLKFINNPTGLSSNFI